MNDDHEPRADRSRISGWMIVLPALLIVGLISWFIAATAGHD